MIDSCNTQKVINMLREHSDNREIIIGDISSLLKYNTYLGAVNETQEAINIYLNTSYSEKIQEATLVHEILHVILTHEGYPKIIINNIKLKKINPQVHEVVHYLRDQFNSIIEHPIVFSREINLFNLDIDEYFKIQVEKKIERFDKRKLKEIKNIIFINQQDILIGLDYFNYPQKHKEEILNVFKERNPDSYRSCLSLYKKLKFNTIKDCYRSAYKIKNHIIKYGKRKGKHKLNILWDTLDVMVNSG